MNNFIFGRLYRVCHLGGNGCQQELCRVVREKGILSRRIAACRQTHPTGLQCASVSNLLSILWFGLIVNVEIRTRRPRLCARVIVG
jgi:hypothetical protein